MSKVFELVIVGSGPAGLTAAIYASRAKIDVLVIEENFSSGGQILNTYEVDNYPGFPGISGPELGKKMREHADRFGIEFLEDSVVNIETEGGIKKIITPKKEIHTKTVLLATGANHSKLGIPGEEELSGMGVSYCATCDGAFFKNKTVFVIGGGDTALEEAVFLARICEKVYLVHRRDSFRGSRSMQEKLKTYENIEIIWDSIVLNIEGEDKVEKVKLKNLKTETEKEMDADGVFISIGINPNLIKTTGVLNISEEGYIIASENCETNIPGIYVAGDLRKKDLRQIVTAVSDGANAIFSIEKYIT